MADSEATLRAAEDIVRFLQQHQVDAVVIGAVALAAYHYVRQTEDIDLGVNASIPKLREVTLPRVPASRPGRTHRGGRA